MTDDCNCCVPIRFINRAGEAVSTIFWTNKDVLALSTLGIAVNAGKDPSRGIDLEVRQYDVVNVRPALIGYHLVNELQIVPHVGQRKSAIGALRSWWKETKALRHANPSFTIVAGLLSASAILLLAFLALKFLGVLDHPFASMVWIWAVFGANLGTVVSLFTLAFCLLLLRNGQYFFAGGSFVFGIGLAILATDVAEILARDLPRDANWPSSYLFFWDEFKLIVNESLPGWAQSFETLWPTLTLILNGVGLTVVVTVVDAIIPMFLRPPDDRGTKIPGASAQSSTARSLAKIDPAARAAIEHWQDALSKDGEPNLLRDMIDAALQEVDQPFMNADLTALPEPFLVVPKKPEHC